MRIVRAWGPAILWMAVIFLLSGRQSISVSTERVWNFLFFKTLHVIEYGFLFFLYVRAMNSAAERTGVGIYASAFALTILYAMTDELHQTFVPTREGKLRDVIIDGIGAGLVWISLSQLLPKMPRKLRSWVKTLLHQS